jgi:hypothetical protein
MIASKERYFSDLRERGFFPNGGSTAARPASWNRCQNDGAISSVGLSSGAKARFVLRLDRGG